MNRKLLFFILCFTLLSSVSFADKTRTLNTDATGSNIGIGTTNPTKELYVVGDVHATGDITCDGSCGGGSGTTVLRITTATTLTTSYEVIYCDTDGGAFTVTLPAGSDGTSFKIINVGSSDNDLTIDPNGTELIFGDSASYTLLDGESITITWETTENWF